MSPGTLRHLFEPRHVAIVGASRTPGKIGHVVVRYLIDGGYAGRVFPVNPGGGDIDGVPCLRTVAELPEAADCAFLVVPANAAVEAVRACAARGVKAVIVGSSGFAEAGTAEGEGRQREIAALARGAGMRVLGPNTNGIYNKSAKLSLGYNSAHGVAMPPGPVSIVSHSGALFSGFARALSGAGVGLSKFVPVGNEADIDMLDVLEYCIADADTGVIGLAIEALSDGARFRALAVRAATAAKPIVALKIGRSAAGVGAALAHSSRLAGGARAYDALFAACAVASARSVEALAAGCALLARRQHAARGNDTRLVCVTTSGAGGALIADHAADRGMALAGSADGSWQGEAAAAIARIPSRGIIRNPIDTGSFDGDWSDLEAFLLPLENDGLNGPTVVFSHVAPTPEMDQQLLRALAGRSIRTGSPIVVIAPGGLTPELERQYIDAGIAVFRETALAFDTLACHFATLAKPAQWRDAAISPAAAAAATLVRTLRRGRNMLSEVDSANVLRAAGIPVVESRAATAPEEARASAEAAGYPVALKALAPGVAHKNSMGFVITSIRDAPALLRAHAQLGDRVAARGFNLDDVAFVLQPMIAGTAEVIVGVSRQAKLGHFLLVGVGGVHAEVIDETVLFPLALDSGEIRTRLAGSRVGQWLAAAGGEPTLDAFMKIADALQQFVQAAGDAIESIDLNPVIVTADDGLVAVDALVVFADRADPV